MKEKHLWSRRKFSKAVLSAQLLLASGALAIPTSCLPDTKSKDKNGFTKGQTDILQLAMDEIIPKTKRMPAPSEIGAIDYIGNVLKKFAEIKPVFDTVLQQLDELSSSDFDSGFSSLSKTDRITALKSFEQKEAGQFTTLRLFVYEAYYTNPTVWDLIGYESYPTGSAGPKMEPFDNSLLSRVQTLNPSFKNI